ncbi:MAG: SRPBCC family protein [Puniceicoccaceae bacterium]|nr:MAG: SRPBCC family protein [Puniceicoccaceae bacterium]
MPADQTLLLRSGLLANAVFSFLSGTILLLRPETVAGWLGLEGTLVLILIGAGLLLFAADLIWQATRPRLLTWRALGATSGDLLWIAATAVVLLIFPESFSAAGRLLLLGVAAAVGGFAVWQWAGIDRAHREIPGGPYRHCVLVSAAAPPEALWPVVSDLAGIRHYMPMLRRSVLRNSLEPGVGAVRECEDHSGKRWAEQCIAFEPGRSFTLNFLAHEPGFPFPARSMVGGWEVLPDTPGRSLVKVWWELEPRPLWLAPLLLPLLAFGADRVFPQAIRRMAAAATGTHSEEEPPTSPAPATRLIKTPC